MSTIMTQNLITVDVNESLRKVDKLFKENHIRHLPVVSGSKLVGIISKSDIMRLSFGQMFDGQDDADEAVFDMLSLEQVMVSNPKVISEDENIKDVAEKFTEVEFHALPVVKENEIVGIVSTTDLLKYLLEQY